MPQRRQSRSLFDSSESFDQGLAFSVVVSRSRWINPEWNAPDCDGGQARSDWEQLKCSTCNYCHRFMACKCVAPDAQSRIPVYLIQMNVEHKIYILRWINSVSCISSTHSRMEKENEGEAGGGQPEHISLIIMLSSCFNCPSRSFRCFRKIDDGSSIKWSHYTPISTWCIHIPVEHHLTAVQSSQLHK